MKILKIVRHENGSSGPGANDKPRFQKPDKKELRERLTDLQYKVTMEAATEAPFANEYYETSAAGLYVDITTGEPLFTSDKKFDAGCGWPSFTAPIDESLIVEKTDLSRNMRRTEVRSGLGDAHLGHVFNDGPEDEGGLRYCINSAALRFIPLEKLEEEGYGEWIDKIDPNHEYRFYDSHSIREREKQREREEREKDSLL